MITFIGSEQVPASFPMTMWNAQAMRYNLYWYWFRGDALNEEDGKDDDGNPVYRWPLRINSIRDFARKHAALLFGEAPDAPVPLVRTVVTPKRPFDGSEYSESDKNLATVAQNVVNEVWMTNGGRALQQENGVLQEALGGCCFQITYDSDREQDMAIPIVIKNWPVDFILPIWQGDNFWELLECYLIYRISGHEAKTRYGTDNTSTTSYVYYVEHWKRDTYSIYVNGKPLTYTNRAGVTTTFENVTNPFGFVPFIYIPNLREGNFYGSSLVEDIVGLVQEYNSRMADMGDAIKETVDRKRYMTNVSTTPKERILPNGAPVVDLGPDSPVAKHPPSVDVEDPPQFSESFVNFTQKGLWTQLLRQAGLSDTAYGEDEGSQRSALTLAFRMWPSTSRARAKRSFWDTGMSRAAWMILRICAVKKIPFGKVTIPLNFNKFLSVSHDWNPMIPRDREQQVNELVLRGTQFQIPLRDALTQYGDVRNVDDAMKEIEQDMERMAKHNAKSKTQTDVASPVAASGVQDKSS